MEYCLQPTTSDHYDRHHAGDGPGSWADVVASTVVEDKQTEIVIVCRRWPLMTVRIRHNQSRRCWNGASSSVSMQPFILVRVLVRKCVYRDSRLFTITKSACCAQSYFDRYNTCRLWGVREIVPSLRLSVTLTPTLTLSVEIILRMLQFTNLEITKESILAW